jgi:L-lactate dehydrogenase complex protein LldE
VLERWASRATSAAQTCCGQLRTRRLDEARAVVASSRVPRRRPHRGAVGLVRIVRGSSPRFEAGFPEYQDAVAIVGRLHEFSHFLVHVVGTENVGAAFPRWVTYHDSCHLLRELGVKDEPRRLLARVRGLELVEMAASDTCCGFGGVFSIKQPEISSAMAATRWNIRRPAPSA